MRSRRITLNSVAAKGDRRSPHLLETTIENRNSLRSGKARMDHATSEGCAGNQLDDRSGVTIDGIALASGTNDQKLIGLQLYDSKQYRQAMPYSTRYSQANRIWRF